jgi:hypothetical protein
LQVFIICMIAYLRYIDCYIGKWIILVKREQMAIKRILWTIGTLLLSAIVVVAQGAACPELIYDALNTVNEVCSYTERNQVCYGNFNIEVSGHDGAELTFSEPGDVVDLADVEEIHTSVLDVASEQFGVALLRAQADLSNTIPGQNVTFLLMGDVSMTDNSGAIEGANPMQAFIFRPGVGDSNCEGVDYNTIVIDSPDNTVVNLNINGVDVDLGSTAVLIDKPDNKIDILIIEGEGVVTAQGETVIVEEGNWTQIPMGGESGVEAIGAPETPVPFPARRIAHIPFDLLHAGENVALNRPVTADVALGSHPAENAVNGDSTDEWNSGTEGAHSIEIDLEGTFNVGELRAVIGQTVFETFTGSYRILVAGESREFQEIHSFDASVAAEPTLALVLDAPLPNVRYVRFETVDSTQATAWGEIEVIAAGYAGCTATSASTINLREAPSTAANVAGTLDANNLRIVSGQTLGADGSVWWRLHGAVWVRSDVVTTTGACAGVPSIVIE